MTEAIARKLLKLADWSMEEQFFQKNGLRELGWCSNYMLDRRSVNYLRRKKLLRKLKLLSFIGLIILQIDFINNNL